MVYLYLALSGILDGGVIFGAKVLSNLGASLFELMIYPNLLSVLFIAYFARCDLHKLWRIPLKMKFLFAAALFFITLGQYTPIFLKIPVTLVVLLIYLQPVWHHFDRTLLFSPPPDAAELVSGRLYDCRPVVSYQSERRDGVIAVGCSSRGSRRCRIVFMADCGSIFQSAECIAFRNISRGQRLYADTRFCTLLDFKDFARIQRRPDIQPGNAAAAVALFCHLHISFLCGAQSAAVCQQPQCQPGNCRYASAFGTGNRVVLGLDVPRQTADLEHIARRRHNSDFQCCSHTNAGVKIFLYKIYCKMSENEVY